MKVYADRKPLVSEVTGWNRIYHNGDVQIYEAENYHDFYKVTTATSRPKFFFGETAWMDTQRYALDKGNF